MKRSRAVPLTLVASAAALAGCGRQEAMHCVERGSNRVVPDSLCARTGAPTVNTPVATAGAPPVHTGGVPPIFLWYYGGRALNGLVSGGSWAPIGGRRYRSSGGFYVGRGGGGVRFGRGSGIGGRSAPSARGGFGGIGGGRSVFS